MDSTGLFIALIVAIISVEIFRRLEANPHLVIKMPDSVPPAVATSFAALTASNDHHDDFRFDHDFLQRSTC